MRTLMRAAARLYPRRWRERYEREFDALLEDVDAGWYEVLNIAYGAVMMQLKRAGVVAGVCAVVGAVISGAASLRMPETYASSATLRLPSTEEVFLQRAQQALAAESIDVKRRAAVTIDAPVDARTKSTMLTVRFADRDPEEVRQVTERILGAVLTANGIPSNSIWTVRTGPNRRMVTGVGGTVGLMLGALFVRFRRNPHAAVCDG
jgi:hypothetical protein